MFLCVCVCAWVCGYVCVYSYMYVCICIYVRSATSRLRMSSHSGSRFVDATCIPVCMCLYIQVCTFLYVCMYIHPYLDIYIWTYMYKQEQCIRTRAFMVRYTSGLKIDTHHTSVWSGSRSLFIYKLVSFHVGTGLFSCRDRSLLKWTLEVDTWNETSA